MSVERDLREVIARLELVSHGTTARLDAGPRGESMAVTPPGGAPWADDWHRESVEARRSHLYFQAKMRTASPAQLVGLLVEAEAALLAWRRAPLPTDPVPGSFGFRRMVALSDESPSELHRKFGVARSTVYRWRVMYRDEK